MIANETIHQRPNDVMLATIGIGHCNMTAGYQPFPYACLSFTLQFSLLAILKGVADIQNMLVPIQ